MARSTHRLTKGLQKILLDCYYRRTVEGGEKLAEAYEISKAACGEAQYEFARDGSICFYPSENFGSQHRGYPYHKLDSAGLSEFERAFIVGLEAEVRACAEDKMDEVKVQVEVNLSEEVEEVLEGNGPDLYSDEQKALIRELDWREIGKQIQSRLSDYAAEWIGDEIHNQLHVYDKKEG